MVWTDDKVKNLKKLWSKGQTTAEIAKKLGISKNSVIGKAHRLNLEVRTSPVSKNVKVKRKTVSKKGENITLMDLRLNLCRWPIGEPSDTDFHFCGEITVTGKPYCMEHCKDAYTNIKDSEKKTDA